jgi:hypothetical protein
VVGSYCRNLTADDAFALTCSGSTIEVKNSDAGTATWTNRNICPSGWRLPQGGELACICNANKFSTDDYYFAAARSGYSLTCYDPTRSYYACWAMRIVKRCDPAGNIAKCTVVDYQGLYGNNNITGRVRCVRN